MTPYELNLFVGDFNDKRKFESEERLILTYLGAAWQRAKKLPNLKNILGRESANKKMTDDEMFEQVKKINALFGGKEEVE